MAARWPVLSRIIPPSMGVTIQVLGTNRSGALPLLSRLRTQLSITINPLPKQQSLVKDEVTIIGTSSSITIYTHAHWPGHYRTDMTQTILKWSFQAGGSRRRSDPRYTNYSIYINAERGKDYLNLI